MYCCTIMLVKTNRNVMFGPMLNSPVRCYGHCCSVFTDIIDKVPLITILQQASIMLVCLMFEWGLGLLWHLLLLSLQIKCFLDDQVWKYGRTEFEKIQIRIRLFTVITDANQKQGCWNLKCSLTHSSSTWKLLMKLHLT